MYFTGFKSLRQLSRKNATQAIFLGPLRAKAYQKISEPQFGKFVLELGIQVRTLFSMKYLTYQSKIFYEKTVSNVLVSFLNTIFKLCCRPITNNIFYLHIIINVSCLICMYVRKLQIHENMTPP